MKKIPLTQGKFALVDDEDYDRLVAMGKWFINAYGYAVKSKRRRKPDGKWTNDVIFMHRLIMDAPSGMCVDHIKFDRLDNRKTNLRLCTRAENNRNVGLSKNNTTGYKGVFFMKSRGKFVAQITVDRKNMHLGYFTCSVDAAKAYNFAAEKYHGDFAQLNQIPA